MHLLVLGYVIGYVYIILRLFSLFSINVMIIMFYFKLFINRESLF